jgi:dihydrofolate synthase/folylpolyglutamate synthase
MKLDLDRVFEAARLRGDPQQAMGLVVQVAGTNGKGSTAVMVESMARAAGYRTGLFTSPHLHRFGERIRIDGIAIPDDEMEPRVRSLLDATQSPGFPELSFFEIATLVAFEAFRDARTNVAVLEVGLGGRLDATSVASANVAVITKVSFDHCRILGADLAQIADEKAGIIREGCRVVSARQHPHAADVIERVATERQAHLAMLDRDFHVRPSRDAPGLIDVVVHGATRVDVPPHTYRGLRVGLPGSHQVDNAACAVAAVDTLRDSGAPIDDAAVARGLAEARWPGRIETIDAGPPVILDVAHNPDGCATLAAYLATRPRKKRALVFGAMRDKDLDGMLRPLEGIFAHRVWTRPNMERAEEPARLAQISYGEVIRNVARAVRRAQSLVGEDGEVVVAGSLFVVAEARAMLLDLESEESIGL